MFVQVVKHMLGMYRVELRQREGPLAGHELSCPVIVSADNLDYQQSYSRVYSGNQSIGWHGTTLQITLSSSQQPTLMETSADVPRRTCSNDLNTTRLSTGLVKRTHSTLSPYKTQFKTLLNRRTRIETTLFSQYQYLLLSQPLSQPHRYSQEIGQSISIEQFELQHEEKKSFKKLGEICEQYIVLQMYRT